jgi:ABC-2 type transport system ATP-binding protein
MMDTMSKVSGGPMAMKRSHPVIAVKNLRKTFGSVEAVSDVSFKVEPGQVLGLLGPNGAGKTTIINMICTLLQIDAGEATVGGFDVQSEPDVVRQLIGLAGQSAAVDEKLTARENLELFGRLYKIPRVERRQRIEGLIDRFGLSDFADRPASTYSGGERRRLDVVAALVADPPVVFLDEPTTGLDPRSRSELWDTVRSLASSGVAIVLSTQYLDEADRLADEILVIDQGRIVAQGTPEALKRELERDVLEVKVASRTDLDTARDLIGSEASIDIDSLRIDIPVSDGTNRSLDLLRKIQDGGVSIANFHLRQPTLDDVFLALTGSAVPESEEVAT